MISITILTSESDPLEQKVWKPITEYYAMNKSYLDVFICEQNVVKFISLGLLVLLWFLLLHMRVSFEAFAAFGAAAIITAMNFRCIVASLHHCHPCSIPY